MNKHRFMATLVGALFAASAWGCAADSNEVQTLFPLIAQDSETGADRGLAGVYNSETQVVWLASSTVDAALDLAITAESAVDPRVVVMRGDRLDSPSAMLSATTSEAIFEAGFAPDDQGRACVLDANTNRWMITKFRVGNAAELSRVPEEFIPSILEIDCYNTSQGVICTDVIDVDG